MPFIKWYDRLRYDEKIEELLHSLLNGTQGDVAYVVYRLVKRENRYTALSKARAVLRDVLDILDEEYLAYEHKMRNENGDIS